MHDTFLEYGSPKKIMQNSGGYLISDKFKTFCRSLNIEHTYLIIIPSPGQLTGGNIYQPYKVNTKKFFDAKSDPYIALLQIRSTPLGSGLWNPDKLQMGPTLARFLGL